VDMNTRALARGAEYRAK